MTCHIRTGTSCAWITCPGWAVETAQRAYDIAEAQMTGGTIDIVTLLNTQRTLFQAQDLLVQVKLAHAQAVVGLFRALGGGWQVGA